MKIVLVVEDEVAVRDALVKALSDAGHLAAAAAGLKEARAAMLRHEVACVLLDLRLRDGDGMDLLRELRAGEHADIPVIVATAYGDSQRTIEAMRDGAFEYLTKPFDLPLLLATIHRALRQRELAEGAFQARAQAAPAKASLVGSSEAMLAVWKIIGRAAASDVPVLITGETGTGKELVARAIHEYSPRSAEPFVAVNLAALAPTLIESELMGHEKGAFTGAATRRQGRLELAGAGTLLLDEIGDLDPALQTKLLRVLQQGTFERVGGEQSIELRARVIAATNKPITPGKPGAALRDDLFYRLAVVAIEVPPLRARRSDIPLLVANALDGKRARAVTEPAMARLMAYDWPGNVRELIHVLGRAAVMCAGEVIDLPDLPSNVASAERETREGQELESMTLRDAVAVVERRLILAALDRAGGNRSEAARRLGIGRPQLYAKLEEHGLASTAPAPPSSKRSS